MDDLPHAPSGLKPVVVAKAVSLGASLHDSSQPCLTPTCGVPISPHVLKALRSSQDCPSAPGSPLHFRLYKYSSNHQIRRLSLSEDQIQGSLLRDKIPSWDAALDPHTSAELREAKLATLLGLSTEGLKQDPLSPKADQEHYQGVYILSASAVEPHSESNASDHLQPLTPSRTFSSRRQGEEGTTDHRLFVQKQGNDVSPWHDIPMQNADGTLNFVCEIPKNTSAKLEVATGEVGNPLKQDIKKGALRFYPYPIKWNYGMIPQTWEDPEHSHPDLEGVTGDNDPVDVVEIGGTQLTSGSVYRVKPLGAYAMIDDGELDWKIICVCVNDPLADKLHDIEDVERELPGEMEEIMVWFRDYKIPDGKPPNAFGFDSKPLNCEFARRVIEETHFSYKNLKNGTRLNNVQLALS